MKKIIIIFTARNRGFGPISKCVTICQELKKVKDYFHSVFLGVGGSLSYAQSSQMFDSIIDLNSLQKDEYFKLIKDCKFCVSVMEQEIALDCYINNIDYYYFDSLFDFWEVNQNIFADKISKNIPKNKDYIDNQFSSHERKILAHFFAKKSFIQSLFYKESDRFISLKSKLSNTFLITPIFIPLNFENNGFMEDVLLVNLGGLRNHDSSGYYYEFIKNISIKILKDTYLNINEIIIVSGYYDKHEVKSIGKKIIRHTFFAHDYFMNLMNKVQYYISAPGLTAIIENLSLRNNVIVSFEQHKSHYYNLTNFMAHFGTERCLSISDYFDSSVTDYNLMYKYALKNNDISNHAYNTLIDKLIHVRNIEIQPIYPNTVSNFNNIILWLK